MAVFSARAKDTYMELVCEFPLVSIRSDKHLAAAQTILDNLGKENYQNQQQKNWPPILKWNCLCSFDPPLINILKEH